MCIGLDIPCGDVCVGQTKWGCVYMEICILERSCGRVHIGHANIGFMYWTDQAGMCNCVYWTYQVVMCVLDQPSGDMCIGQTKWRCVYWTNQVVEVCILDTPIEVVCIGPGGDV